MNSYSAMKRKSSAIQLEDFINSNIQYRGKAKERARQPSILKEAATPKNYNDSYYGSKSPNQAQQEEDLPTTTRPIMTTEASNAIKETRPNFDTETGMLDT